MEELPIESMESIESSMNLLGPLAALGTGAIIFLLVFCIFLIACYWIVVEKAGKPGWSQIIPIWNIIVLIQVAKKPEWWIILILFLPLIGLIWWIKTLHGISKNFGHGAGFTVGLFFLGFIFWPILAFGSSKYIG